MKGIKKSLALFIIVSMIFNFGLVAYAAGDIQKVYVSVDGSDTTGTGSNEAPFATLTKARDYVRTLSKSSDITVNIGAGEYFVDSPVVFNAEDTGSENCTITYKADKNAVFTNTKTVNTAEFQHVTNPDILKRLKKSVRSQVLELDLSKYCTPSKDTSLILEDEKLTFSRYPNDTFLTVENDQYDTTFNVNDENVKNWTDVDNLFLTGSLNATYYWNSADVKDIANDGSITASLSVRNAAEVYFRNVLEELDAVGEYAIDIGAGKLYCILPSDYSTKTVEITSGTLNSHFIFLSNLKNVNFEGICFRGLSGIAILIDNCDNVTIKNCDFKFIDTANTIEIKSSNDITVDGNSAYELTGKFVKFSGRNGKTLEPDNIRIVNNVILNCGTEYYQGGIIHAGIATTGVTDNVGNVIENNIIGDCSATHAIHAIGVNNQITKNEIYNVSRQIDDGGTIYFGKSNTKYGNEVSYNYIHHLNKDNMYAALYSDDGYGGVNMHHNVMYSMQHPIHIGMGMNNKFDNNMFIDVTRGIRAQTRMTWGEELYGNNGQLYVDTNRILTDSATKAAYSSAFDGYLVKAVARKPFFAPYDSQIVGNVSFGSVNAVYETPKHTENDALVDELATYGAKVTDSNGTNLNGTQDGNPKIAYNSSYFADANNQNFTLTENAPSSASQLKSINMNEIGNITASENNLLNTYNEFNVYPMQSDNKIVIYYGNRPSATKYKITVSQNADYSNPVLEKEIFEDNMITAVETPVLSNGTYYIKAVMTGLSKQSQYDKTATTTFEVKDSQEASYDYAFSLLEDEVESINAGLYDYDEELKASLTNKYNELNGSTVSDKAAAETQIYALLTQAQASRKVYNPRINKCEADRYNYNVYVEASGFEPNTFVTALVTTPNSKKEDFANGNNEIVRYTKVLSSDENGELSFDFDTSIKDIDYTGIYTVYLSDVYGKVISKTYEYGTIETSVLTFETSEGTAVDISELKAYKGIALTANISVNNRFDTKTPVNVILGTYKYGKLTGITMENKALNSNSKNDLSVSFTVPLNYDDDTSIELMITDGEDVLRPMILKRAIKEVKGK